MSVELWVLGLCAVVQAGLLWRQAAAARVLSSVESRLARQAGALDLLTETSETGFAVIARELERMGAAQVKPAPRARTRRLASAARTGQSVEAIAAAEGVSEGEVRLRLHLAGHPVPEDDRAPGIDGGGDVRPPKRGRGKEIACRAVHTSR